MGSISQKLAKPVEFFKRNQLLLSFGIAAAWLLVAWEALARTGGGQHYTGGGGGGFGLFLGLGLVRRFLIG